MTDDQTRFFDALKNISCGRESCWLESTGSTNDDAFAAAEAGASDFTVIAAGQQTNGRGRMQRTWVMTPGSSLAMSVLLRPTPEETGWLNLFSPLAGLAVCEALRTGYGLPAEVKWPNDVLLGRKKFCGVLCETRWSGEKLLGPVLGIGVNILHGSVPDIPGKPYPATCIEDAAGVRLDRFELIAGILEQCILLRPLLGTQAFIDLWQERLAYRGEEVQLVCPEQEPIRAVVNGIDPEGCLAVTRRDGTTDHILAGEISLRPVSAMNP